jgi:hypothetical protein
VVESAVQRVRPKLTMVFAILMGLTAHHVARLPRSRLAIPVIQIAAAGSVAVPVMDIGIVRMGVGEGLVAMLVRMGLASIPGEGVRMLVMGIVTVAVRVDEQLMRMLVLVPFGEVQPDPRRHQRRGQPEGWRSRFVKDRDSDRSAHEWCRGEISSCAG